MRITATPAVSTVIDRVRSARTGVLSITLGTGCCESTAPFLYEDYYAGPDAEQVGDVDGVPVLAGRFLLDLYRGDDELVIDAIEDVAESFSIETEFGFRLVLRNGDATTCKTS